MKLNNHANLIAVVLFTAMVLGVGAVGLAQESPFIYGIHDHDTGQQEYLNRLAARGVTGWVTATIAIGSDPNNYGGDDFRWISNQGHAVIVRLNHGYCSEGTIPSPERYDDFARRAANYVAATQGADIFVIGNETNLAMEWAPINGYKRYVSPQDYATCFRMVYDRIKAIRPDAQVVVQPLAPFAGPYNGGNICGSSHDGNSLNWIQYMRQMLEAIKSTGGLDGIALHINSRGYRNSDIHSTRKVTANGQNLYFSFYVYKDWIDLGIPADLYHLPLYATECNGIYSWDSYEPGWIQEVYAEINRYNQQAVANGKPVYHAVNMYRWCAHCDDKNIDDSPYKDQILADLDQAAGAAYAWPNIDNPPPAPVDPPDPPANEQLIVNGDFSGGLAGWTVWLERGLMDKRYPDGQLQLAGNNFNGAVYQQFATGGAGTVIDITGFWESDPTAFQAQWAEVLIINGPRLPAAGRDVKGSDADVVIMYRNDTWSSVAGWSGAMTHTAPVANNGTFTAAGDVATIILKSGNIGGGQTGTRFDNIAVTASGSNPLPPTNQPPRAVLSADPTSGAPPLEVFFDAGDSSDSDGDPLTFEWQFGDNTGGGGMTISHTYADPGSFLARLTVADDQGQTDEATIVITVTDAAQLIVNGNFGEGLSGWSNWTDRGSLNTAVTNGQIHLQGTNFNGGVYQQFSTGGAGSEITVSGIWASNPTVANSQWAEVLLINGPRLPVDGQDIKGNDADVVLIYKNSTWTSPGGWSGEMALTSAAASNPVFKAAGDVATIILKSGNLAGISSGTRYDNISVSRITSIPPPGNNDPIAAALANPTGGPAPLTVSFDAGESFDPDGDGLQFSWNFGDGRQATDADVVHTYELPGLYHAVLTVTDESGGADSVTIAIEVSGQTPPAGTNLVTNPGFEGNFTNGRAEGWRAWTVNGQGYWKQSSRIGRIGSGSYAGGGNIVQAVKRLNPKVILLEGNALGMAAELRRTLPDALMIGRIYFDDLYSQYLSDPERYGRILAERCIALNRPEIDVWQGINEPYVNDPASARKAARFDKAFSDRIQDLGKKSVVLNLAVGNPGDMAMMLLPEIVDLLATADYVGYHTYGGNKDLLLIGPQSPYFSLRWRFYADMYAARGLRMPPVIYTEANTFYQWKVNTPDGKPLFEPWQIRDDLIAFEEESRKDPWSVGIAIYLFGSSSAKFEGREMANEPVIYEGGGDHNWNHPADAKAGIRSQQFGTDAGAFEGGIVQRVQVEPGAEYRLAGTMKYETRLPRSSIAFWVGYDLTGQLNDAAAGTIAWTTDLIAGESRETDIWYTQTLQFTATGDSVSIWFAGSQREGDYPFRISLDEVGLERLE